MAEDIATLSLKIDSTPVAQASGELNKMAAAAKNASTEGAVFREKIGGMTVYLREQFKGMAEVFAGLFAAHKFLEWANEITFAAARFNELGIALDVLGRNTGYTRAYIDDLVESIKKMGMDDDDARQQIAKMMETNIGLAHAIDLVRVAQDASIISGESVKSSLEAIDVAIQTGMARTLKHMGINVDFVKAEKALADSLGVTTAQLTEQEKIQARVNATMEASKNISGAMAAAWNDPIQVMQRAKVALEDFEKEIGQAFQPVFVASANAFTNAVKFLGGHVEDIVKGMGALKVAVETFIAVGIVGFLGKWVAGWVDVAIAINAGRAANIAAAESGAALATAMGTQAVVADAIAAANKRAGATTALLTAAMGSLRAMLASLWTLMGGWVGVIAAVVGGLYYFRDAEITVNGTTAEMRDFYEASWVIMKEGTLDAVNAIIGYFPVLGSSLDDVITNLKNSWQSFLSWWESTSKTTVGKITRSILDSAASLSPGPIGVIKFLTGLGDVIADRAKDMRDFREEATKYSDIWDKLLFAPQVPFAAPKKWSMIPETSATAAPGDRPVDPAQENAAMKETLALMKEQAALQSQINLLKKGQDPDQNKKLVELQQELTYNKDLSKAGQDQKDAWLAQAKAIDTAAESLKVLKDTYSVKLNTAQLNLENDALAKNAHATLYLAEAKKALELATTGVDEATKKANLTAQHEADLAQQRHDLIMDAQASLDDLAQINASMIIDDQERALAQLAIEDQLWKEKMAVMDKGSAAYKAALDAHNKDIAAKTTFINTQQWRDDVKKMEGVFHDGFIKMVEGGKGAWSSFVTSLRNTFKSELADELYKMFAKPFVVQIVASIVGLTGAGTASAGGVQGAAQSGSNLLGSISNIGSSIGKMFSGSYSQAPQFLQDAVGSNAAYMLSTAVQAIGIGYAGTKLGSSLGGNNQTGGNIGGMIGGAIGTAFGPVGTFVGSTIGSFIGSFLGNQTASNYTAISKANLATSTMTQLPGDSPNANTVAGANQLANNAINLSQMLTQATGATEQFTQVMTEVGQRDRIAFTATGDNGLTSGYKTFAVGDLKGATVGLTQALIDGLSGISDAVKTQMKAVVGKIDFSNAQQAASDLQFSFALLSGKLVDTTKPLSNMQQAINQLKATFDAAAAQATRLGLATTAVEQARQQALAALTQGFNDQIQQSILAITDPMAAALAAEATSAASRLQEARDGGANLVAVEQLTALERDQIIQKYAGQSTSALSGAGKSILDFVRQLTGTTASPLATQTALDNAKKYYNDTLAAAQGGDVVAQSNVTQAAKDYLDLQRQMYASSDQYFVVFNSVVASMKMLANSMGVTAGAVGTSGYTAAQQAALDKIAAVIKDAQTPVVPTTPAIPSVPGLPPGATTPSPAPNQAIPQTPTRATAKSARNAQRKAQAEAQLAATQELGRTMTRGNADLIATLQDQIARLQSTIARQQTTLDRLANAPRKRA